MNEYEKKVLECHQAMELDIDAPYSIPLLTLRQRLINEEVEELNAEINTLCSELEQNGTVSKETKLKMFKELADVQYVISGMAVALGIPLQEVFNRVHTSNMSKLVDGKPIKRADGKFLKGPNYKKPDLTDLG